MESIKDYAKRHNVSYEAVRQQVKRYGKELENHITRVGKKQYLDDEAVAFLDQKRQDNPIVIMQLDKDEEIHRLTNENKALLLKIAELQEALLQEKDQVKLLQTEKIALLEDKNQQKIDLEQQNRELLEEIRSTQEALIEAQSKKKGLFSRLFGKE